MSLVAIAPVLAPAGFLAQACELKAARTLRSAAGVMRRLGRLAQACLFFSACECQFDGSQYESAFHLSDDSNETSPVQSCFFANHGYQPHLALNSTSENCFSTTTAEECQERCASLSVCFYFTFWGNGSRCCLSGSDATYGRQDGAVTGPKTCDEASSACTQLPGADFPGSSVAFSELAWPSHRVPKKLECWPKNWTAGRYLPCAIETVLEDSESGFPGLCSGLTEIPIVPQFETCESLCRKSSFCSLFQTMRSPGPTGAKSCWLAYGTSGSNCYINPAQTYIPIRAVRFQQGEVRVLKKLKGVVVKGLMNAFGPYWFLNVSDAIRTCKLNCHSNILCQYWQYNRVTGCWVEDPPTSGAVAFPPTTQTWDASDPTVATMMDGEYLQHVCSEARGPALLRPSAASEEEPATPEASQAAEAPATPEHLPALRASASESRTYLTAAAATSAEQQAQAAHMGVPWYCWMCLCAMLAVCLAAGVMGYMSSQSDDDQYRAGFLTENGKVTKYEEHKEAKRLRHSARAASMAVHGNEAAGNVFATQTAPAGISQAAHEVSHAASRVAHEVAHEVAVAGHTVAATAQHAQHRVASMASMQHPSLISGSHGHDPRTIRSMPPIFGTAQAVGPTRDQLLQFAHQPRY